MLLEYFVALLLGILFGTFTGLSPGIHINLISTLIISSPLLSLFSPIYLIIFIVSMSITHTFIDFIPSIFLGAPEEDTFLSILPGHQLLREGKGYEAVILTLYGSIFALIMVLIFIPILILVIPKIYETFSFLIPYILIFVSAYFILREKSPILSFIVFSLSGFLGFFTLNLPINQPLFPLLTGLFGTSALILSLKNKTSIPKQTIIPLKKIFIDKKQLIKSSIAISLASPISSFLPGMGSGQSAFLASEITKHDSRSFLFLVGATNTIIMSLSFIALYSLGKSRTGSAAAINKILPNLSISHLSIIIISIILSSIISFFIGIFIAKKIVFLLNKINYAKISVFVLIFLVVLSLIISNILGLIVLITSTSLGIFCILSNARRINLMGALLIPTILFYLI